MINLGSQEEDLFNVKHSKYMDKDSLNNAINRIVAALKDHDINVSAEEVLRKMYGLRGYFSV